VILKCLILQVIYGFSDPRLEEEIAARRSFQIFLDFSSGDAIPDERIICRYHELFARQRQDKKIFKVFNQQLKDAGMILEKGTIFDALIKQSYTRGSGESRDKDAIFLTRGKKTFFSYKAHNGINSKSKIIRSTDFAPARSMTQICLIISLTARKLRFWPIRFMPLRDDKGDVAGREASAVC
jgi:IS5 family transposase